MSLYDDYSEDYLRFIFSNAVVLKAMHDRGYSVRGIEPDDGPILTTCLDRIFKGVEWKDTNPVLDKEPAPVKDSEEWDVYDEFQERHHYKIKIPIKEVKELWPFTEDELKLINAKMEDIVWDPERFFEDCYLPLWAFYKWEWLKSRDSVIGITLYMFDVPKYNEEPPESLEVLDILDLVDMLRDIKKKRGK